MMVLFFTTSIQDPTRVCGSYEIFGTGIRANSQDEYKQWKRRYQQSGVPFLAEAVDQMIVIMPTRGPMILEMSK
ncbi:7059_t:CDS:2 [Acaulospora colombiana]|uniref:7059_t:CDS:1 n=1 Tax=Acaulospora colombiana TaxID=27376 RepID=A0ACA9LFR7_9GLOM|nr:7059_t:CDS:2 [Acaulospora colombiana]